MADDKKDAGLYKLLVTALLPTKTDDVKSGEDLNRLALGARMLGKLADKDGNVTAASVKASIGKLTPDQIAYLDVNKSGALTPEELKTMRDFSRIDPGAKSVGDIDIESVLKALGKEGVSVKFPSKDRSSQVNSQGKVELGDDFNNAFGEGYRQRFQVALLQAMNTIVLPINNKTMYTHSV